ncbi:MAG: L,D-transpeptidase [Chloroflexi bacterium]|nr:L,D-transpeptidase [Chloroflexota bacterium]
MNVTNEDAKWLFDWASPKQPNSGWLFSDADNPGMLVMMHQ